MIYLNVMSRGPHAVGCLHKIQMGRLLFVGNPAGLFNLWWKPLTRKLNQFCFAQINNEISCLYGTVSPTPAFCF